jgi:hypothetical protein
MQENNRQGRFKSDFQSRTNNPNINKQEELKIQYQRKNSQVNSGAQKM